MNNRFVLYVDNQGYETSSVVRKLYENILDNEAERHNQLRVIDE